MNTDIIIIGAGLNGVCAGYYAQQNNYKYIIFEKTNEIGGIWTNKNVPGIRTDSTTRQYTYSFNKKHTQFNTQYPSGAQISDYIDKTAIKFNIKKHIKFNSQVVKAKFDTKKCNWEIITNDGTFKCKYLVNCNGYFNKKKYYTPKFKGMDTFKKNIVHIYNIKSPDIYKNKNVLLVGSGAMAISSMPELYKHTKNLKWLQRSPSYIGEASTKVTSSDRILQYLDSNTINKGIAVYDQLYNDLIFIVFKKFPNFGKKFFYDQYKKIGIPDKIIKKHLTPKYNPWDQRIPVSQPGLLKLIGDEKIKTYTTTIKEIKSNNIILNNKEIITNIDTIILATGFTIDLCQFDLYIDNVKINYSNKMIYFKHCMINDIPNYFQIVGTLHSTYTVKIEILYKYIFDIINYIKNNNYNCVQIYLHNYDTTLPNLSSNYLKRSINKIPKTVSIKDIPSLDRLQGNYTFSKRHFVFYNNKKDYINKFKNQKDNYTMESFANKRYNVILLLTVILICCYIYIKII